VVTVLEDQIVSVCPKPVPKSWYNLLQNFVVGQFRIFELDRYGLTITIIEIHGRLISVNARVRDQNIPAICEFLLADLHSRVVATQSADTG
jgi:hypothetical protein